MNTLVKKEIRLLLPIWLVAMLLAIGPARFCAPENSAPILTTLFGMAILAVASFGREFAFGTFGMLLTQPMPRRELWKAKLVVLMAALTTVAAGCVICGGIKSIADENSSSFLAFPVATALAIAGGFSFTLLTRQIAPALAFTVLLPAAFAIEALLVFDRFHIESHTALATLTVLLALGAALGIYGSLKLFAGVEEMSGATQVIDLFSRRDHQASSARRPRRPSPPTIALLRKEFGLQTVNFVGLGGLFLLHLAILALRRIFLHADRPQTNDLDALLAWFGLVWFIPPFLIAATAIADERRLGTLDAQRCLPVAAFRQYFLKFVFVLLCGGAVSAILFHIAETLGRICGVRHDVLYSLLGNFSFHHPYVDSDYLARSLPFTYVESYAGLILIFLFTAGIAFYASTLAGSLLEALGLGGVLFLFALAGYFIDLRNDFDFSEFFREFLPLPTNFSLLIMALAMPSLGWLNFRNRESRLRLCLRNLGGVAASVAVATTLSTAIYFRVWEYVLPATATEHGAPLLSLSQPPPRLAVTHRDSWRSNEQRFCSLLFADGRLWISLFTSRLERGQFLAGDDWLDVALASHTIIALRKDGTLWCSEHNNPPRFNPSPNVAAENASPINMHRVGSDTHWKKVVDIGWYAMLLRDDGTLWYWGPADEKTAQTFERPTPPEDYATQRVPPGLVASLWPGLDTFPLTRLDATSQWKDLSRLPLPYSFVTAVDEEGREWHVKYWLEREKQQEKYHPSWIPYDRSEELPPYFIGRRLSAQSQLDTGAWDSTSTLHRSYGAPDSWSWAWPFNSIKKGAIRSDGTLWLLRSDDQTRNSSGKSDKVQISAETNWRSIATEIWPIALKTNGTLWAYQPHKNNADAFRRLWTYGETPAQPGIWKQLDPHQDWVGFYERQERFALAADGSFWAWNLYPESYHEIAWLPRIWMAPSRHPRLLGNIFEPPPSASAKVSQQR